MSINIEMSPQEVADLKQVTKLDDDSQAVAKAAREYLRLIRLRELKFAAGNVEMNTGWQELENLELGESTFPM
jgi:hypothetical protein